MEMSFCWESARCAAIPDFHYCVHNCPLMVRILSQINPVHTTYHISLKMDFNIAHPSTSWSSSWSISIWRSQSFYMCILHRHSCYIPYSSHPPSSDHSNYTWRRVQVMKLLITQFSQTSYHLIRLQSKYSPQHPVLKHSQSMFLS
jgi:hypothetical protein